MSQTKLGSLAEVILNVVIGFAVSVGAQMLVFPLYGFTTLTLHDNVQIVAIFTLISMARSYLVRRMFNWYGSKNEGFKANRQSADDHP